MPLTDKYELRPVAMNVAGQSLEIYEVVRSDRFVESVLEGDDIPISRFPFWVKVWDAAIVLADHLVRSGLDPRANILEIGAGMGVTGLLLGRCGHEVTITDYEDDALALLETNARHNGLDRVCIRKLDWNAPDIKGRFDIICGSELIYSEPAIDPVIDLLDAFLQPGGTVYLAHDLARKCVPLFLDRMNRLFHIETRVKTLTTDRGVCRVVLHTMRRKPPSGAVG